MKIELLAEVFDKQLEIVRAVQEDMIQNNKLTIVEKYVDNEGHVKFYEPLGNHVNTLLELCQAIEVVSRLDHSGFKNRLIYPLMKLEASEKSEV